MLTKKSMIYNQIQKGINIDNIHFWEINLMQYVIMVIVCNDKLCICSNGTIHKLIIITCFRHWDTQDFKYSL